VSHDRTVLIVDDDPDIREVVGEVLDSQGWRVRIAESGVEALASLKSEREPPDVILLDLMMPEMDGWSFRAEQRKLPEAAAVPVIVFTAYSVSSQALEQLDAAAMVRKPVRFETLVAELARVCG
jgi:two-component system response regulator MprA